MGCRTRQGTVIVPALAVLCVVLSVVVAFAALISVVTGEAAVPDSGAAAVDASRFGLSDDALMKLKVRDLKAMIKRKGATCEACVSKADLVERIAEVRDWDDVLVKKPEFGTGGDASEFADDYEGLSRDEKMQRLTENLRRIDPSVKTFMKGKDGKMNDAEIERIISEQARAKGSKKDKRGPGSSGDSSGSRTDEDTGASSKDKPDL
jgi:ARMET, C-terminal